MLLRTGDQVDHYRIDAHVADTPTSTIFKGTDLESGRAVALKVPQEEAESDVLFYDRFQREAAIGLELDHPAIPKVMPDRRASRVYLAMEWVEGKSLREILASSGKLSPGRAIPIAAAICDVLAYIHESGVVHRDLKPENVVVGADGSVKLIDFGIAAKAGARRLTFGKLSQVMGTADYISPEQVKGERGNAASDLYALGVILYEMLTAQVPFQGSNPLAIMNARLICDPLPLENTAPEIASLWGPILQRLLQRDPKQRYQSARALAFDLAHPELVLPAVEVARKRSALTYACIALLPATLFLLLLYVAKHQ
jgi:serine/threonine protein kinase